MSAWPQLLDGLLEAVEELHAKADDASLEDTLLFTATIDTDLMGEQRVQDWLGALGIELPDIGDVAGPPADEEDGGNGGGGGDDDDDGNRPPIDILRVTKDGGRTRTSSKVGRPTTKVRDHRVQSRRQTRRLVDSAEGFVGRIRDALEDFVGEGLDPEEVKEVPLDLDVTWRITDEDGRILYETDVDGRPIRNRADEEDFADLSEGSAATLRLLFGPDVVRPGRSSRPRRRTVEAVLSLTAPEASAERTIGFPVEVHPLTLPAVLALCVEPEFNRFATDKGVLFITPDSGSDAKTALHGELRDLRQNVDDLVKPIRDLARTTTIAARMVARLQGITALRDLLNEAIAGAENPHRRVQVRSKRGIRRLRKVRFRSRRSVALGRSGATAKNSISSVLLFGPPGTTAELYNASRYDPKRGQLNLTTGRFCVAAVDDLHSREPDLYVWDWDDIPSSLDAGPGRETEADPQGSRTIRQWKDVTTFGNELSSARIVS